MRPDLQQSTHLLEQETLARSIRLHPLSIDHKLGDCPLTDVLYDFIGGARRLLYVNLGVRDIVLLQEAFSSAAIAAPRGGVDDQFHPQMIPRA